MHGSTDAGQRAGGQAAGQTGDQTGQVQEGERGGQTQTDSIQERERAETDMQTRGGGALEGGAANGEGERAGDDAYDGVEEERERAGLGGHERGAKGEGGKPKGGRRREEGGGSGGGGKRRKGAELGRGRKRRREDG